MINYPTNLLLTVYSVPSPSRPVYMVVGGCPTPSATHAQSLANLSLDMIKSIDEYSQTMMLNKFKIEGLSIRIGINTGPIRAGVVGQTKLNYKLFGDTVRNLFALISFSFIQPHWMILLLLLTYLPWYILSINR